MNNWISVKDHLPEVFVPVLVCRKNRQGGQIVEAGQKDVGDWWRVYGTRTKSVTHWMPLPDPPGQQMETPKLKSLERNIRICL